MAFKMYARRPSFRPAKLGARAFLQCVLQPGDGTEAHLTTWMREAPATQDQLNELEKVLNQASELITNRMRELGFEPHTSVRTRKARSAEQIEQAAVKPTTIINPED